LHRRIVADGLEIGYWIRADQARRGFAVEAARALTEAGLAVPGVVRIQIHCDPANVVSRRIPERLGYHLIEHRSSDTIDPRGLPRDTVVYERALGQPGEGPAVIPEFGTPAATPDIVGRRAAYALIRDDAGRFLAVRAKYGLFLPGGGCEPGEPPELALTREIREEIGHAVSALRHRATAVQHFNTDGVSYCMTADFYTVLLGDRSAGEAEHDMVWLDPNERGDRWYHACHAWAVRRESAGDDI
jgi:8-oxo-dGTP pyrophosphatase MutT (NUDIX family)